MELSRARQDTALMQPQELSKKSKIVKLLTVFGIRRQAKLDTPDYQVFASDLENYSLEAIEGGLNAIAEKPRPDGQTAFPDVGTILEAVRGHIRANRPTVEEEAARKWLDYLEAAKAEGVTEPDQEMLKRIKALNEKHSLTKPKEPEIQPPVMMTCPHCGEELPVAPNLRFFDPEQMHSLADTLTEVRRLAAANRAADMAAK